MSSNKPNPLTTRTAPQIALLHAGESVVLTAIVTLVAAIYQGVVTHGFNLPALGLIAGPAFLGAFSTVYRSLLTNPNLTPAVSDTINQFKGEVQLLLDTRLKPVEDVIAQITSGAQPVQNAPQALQSSPWGSQAPQVPQQQFPPLPTFTMPQAAISSSQAQQVRQPEQ